MQLRSFLNKGGFKKLNIIAINWRENRYGATSKRRLNNMIKSFHPFIRVIKSNKDIEKHFYPLSAIPTSFIFNREGKLIYGNGNQEFLGTEKITKILKNAQ